MENPSIRFINNITTISNDIVVEIRKELSETYDINSEEYKDFSGLCDTASKMYVDKIKSILHFLPPCFLYESAVTIIHGEQKHHLRIPSKKWGIQHTWVKLNIEEFTLYIDPTSSQFKHIYRDIPDFYISQNKPKWYYSDRSNPVFNGITGKINSKIQIPKKMCINGEDFIAHDGLIEFIQYEVLGRISDFIRKVFRVK